MEWNEESFQGVYPNIYESSRYFSFLKEIKKDSEPFEILSFSTKSMDFLESFKKAKNAFTNHVIYCIFSNKQRSLNPVNEEIPSYLGVVETDEIITYLLSKSYINPINYTSF